MKGTLRYLVGVAGPNGFGSNSTVEEVTEHCCFSNLTSQQTAIITGATSGIGAETARVLAKRGVRVVIPARDLEKGALVKERTQKETPKSEIILLKIDLSSFVSIKRFCSEFLSLGLPLNILINNAGKFCQNLELSEDKIEMTFATNYLGHYLLTEMLMEKMIETTAQTGIEGRIINVSSVIHSWAKRDRFNFNNMLNPKSYNGTRAYAQSKLANILHAKELARQLKVLLGKECKSNHQCRPSGNRKDRNFQRSQGLDHRFSLFSCFKVAKNNISGCIDDMLHCSKPRNKWCQW